MKNYVLFLVMVLVLSLTACGKSDTVIAVEEAIEAIGTVDINSEDDISHAEGLYDILSDSEKEKVENRLELVEAREQYDDVVKKAEEAESESIEEEQNKFYYLAKEIDEEVLSKVNSNMTYDDMKSLFPDSTVELDEEDFQYYNATMPSLSEAGIEFNYTIMLDKLSDVRCWYFVDEPTDKESEQFERMYLAFYDYFSKKYGKENTYSELDRKCWDNGYYIDKYDDGDYLTLLVTWCDIYECE